MQPPAATHVKMEENAQLLTLAPVMWGGRESSVNQVGEWVIRGMGTDITRIGCKYA